MKTPEQLQQQIETIRERVSPEVADLLQDMVEVNTHLATSLSYQGEVLSVMTQSVIAFLGNLGIINPQQSDD